MISKQGITDDNRVAKVNTDRAFEKREDEGSHCKQSTLAMG
jgi:hypothetical protein